MKYAEKIKQFTEEDLKRMWLLVETEKDNSSNGSYKKQVLEELSTKCWKAYDSKKQENK